MAQCFASWSIEDDRSTPAKHGLYEIQEKAQRFIAQQNAKGREQWIALEPNLKTVVPRCAVPLKSVWTPKEYGLSAPSVMVSCTQTVPGSWTKAWRVHVPAMQKQ